MQDFFPENKQKGSLIDHKFQDKFCTACEV